MRQGLRSRFFIRRESPSFGGAGSVISGTVHFSAGGVWDAFVVCVVAVNAGETGSTTGMGAAALDTESSQYRVLVDSGVDSTSKLKP